MHENSLNVRGTSTAIYDYAFFLKHLYNYDCCITYNPNNSDNNNDKKEETEKRIIKLNN